MATRKQGLTAAMDRARRDLAAERAAEFEADPQPMLALTPSAAQAVEAGPAPAPGERGAGRPPGATNKRTQDWIEYYQRLGFQDPMRFLLEVMHRPVETLAAELGCTRKEAFDSMIAAARELQPYWHQKQPIAVEVDGRFLAIHVSATPETLAAVGIDLSKVVTVPLIEHEEESEENQ